MGDEVSDVTQKAPSDNELGKQQKKVRRFYDRVKNTSLYNDEELVHFAHHLVSKIHSTAGARFEAARRLKKKNRLSVVSILVLSFYAILFSMISAFDRVAVAAVKDLLSMLSVFMSSFIIAFSVYEASKRYDVRSENFLRSARLMQEVRDEVVTLFLSRRATWSALQQLEKSYINILATYSDNHANIDFMVFRMNTGVAGFMSRIKIRVYLMATVWWLLILSFLSPVIVFLIYKAVFSLAPLIAQRV